MLPKYHFLLPPSLSKLYQSLRILFLQEVFPLFKCHVLTLAYSELLEHLALDRTPSSHISVLYICRVSLDCCELPRAELCADSTAPLYLWVEVRALERLPSHWGPWAAGQTLE